MLSPLEEYTTRHAYIPEHLIGYVRAISQAEPFLLNDYLCYFFNKHLIFIGYPLKESFEERKVKEVLDSAIGKFKPEYVAIIAPTILTSKEKCYISASDYYYRLDLLKLRIHRYIPYGIYHRKLRSTIERALRELYVEKKQEITNEHIELVSEFLSSHEVDDFTQYIFKNIPNYISSAPTAWVFSAMDKDKKLVAFDIADFGSKDYAFYMFNFISRRRYVPGASDLLLYEVIKAAQKEGKSFINLGLGINDGVRFFKKKWGGVPFLNYEFCLYRVKQRGILRSLLKGL